MRLEAADELRTTFENNLNSDLSLPKCMKLIILNSCIISNDELNRTFKMKAVELARIWLFSLFYAKIMTSSHSASY